MAWQPIETAPFQRVIEVRNKQMEKPCLATRGYVWNGAVHPDNTFCTTVYTPDKFFPVFAGNLCCPTEWREPLPPIPTGED
jgi:hypothetical protein